MKIGRISRRTFALKAANDGSRPRVEILRTFLAVTAAVALIATGAIALPSLAPVDAMPENFRDTLAALDTGPKVELALALEEASISADPEVLKVEMTTAGWYLRNGDQGTRDR